MLAAAAVAALAVAGCGNEENQAGFLERDLPKRFERETDYLGPLVDASCVQQTDREYRCNGTVDAPDMLGPGGSIDPMETGITIDVTYDPDTNEYVWTEVDP